MTVGKFKQNKPDRELLPGGYFMAKIIRILLLSILIIGGVAAQDDGPPRFEEVMEIELRQIHSIVWHPDGEIIAAAGEHDVWLYDADTLGADVVDVYGHASVCAPSFDAV